MEGLFIIFCIVLLLVLFSRFIIVPVNHVVVLTGFTGQFSRTLSNGFNLRMPFEFVKQANWTYLNQQFKMAKFTAQALPVMDQQIDIAPMECVTQDGETISIDFLLVFRTCSPEKAMFSTNDTLNLLVQQVYKHTRAEFAKVTFKDVRLQESKISQDICTIINTTWTPTYGLGLATCEIQGVSNDADTLRRRRQLRDGISFHDQAEIERAHAFAPSRAANVILAQ